MAFLRAPSGPGVRWDAGIEPGNEITLHYDPMLAKLIVWAEDRPAAIRRMRRALNELVITGVATNQAFHRRLLEDPAFAQGEIDIQFLERRADLLGAVISGPEADALAIAAALAEHEARRLRKPAVVPRSATGEVPSAWAIEARRGALD